MVRGLASGHLLPWMWWTLAYFSRKQNFSTADISHIFCRSVTKFGSVRSIAVWQVLRDSGELWSTFIGTQIFDSGYLAHFCHTVGAGQLTLISQILWTLVWGSRNTMRRLSSVLHLFLWCLLLLCWVYFSTMPRDWLGRTSPKWTILCWVVLFCSLAVLDPRVGHTMDVHSPFISILCHSDWLFHRESCPQLDVVYPGRAWSSSPAYTWHCSLHYFFLHDVTIVC